MTAEEKFEHMISLAMASRTAAGLSVETTGIRGRDESFTRHCVSAQERDAYIARCQARGETTRII